MTVRGVQLAAAAAALPVVQTTEGAQDRLVADTDIHGPTLNFEWQDIKVGVGAYQEGPAGLTIIRFMLGTAIVVDSAAARRLRSIPTRSASAMPSRAGTRASSLAAGSTARRLSRPLRPASRKRASAAARGATTCARPGRSSTTSAAGA